MTEPEPEPDSSWPRVPAGGRLVALVPDLMDRSRISAGLATVEFLAGPPALADLGPLDVVLVDLGRAGVLQAVAGCAALVVGFVSHVDEDLAQQARSAGVAEVLARSVFFRRLGR